MAVPYTNSMPHAATYWPPGEMNAHRDPAVGAPVAITCRWQDQRNKVTTRDGTQVTTDSVVYSDRKLAEGGWLFLGTSVAADPTSVVGARDIKATKISPSLDGSEELHKNWL